MGKVKELDIFRENPRIDLKRLAFPGLILDTDDINGQAFMIFNKVMISVHIDNEGMFVCVDEVGESGRFDKNVLWVNCSGEGYVDDEAYDNTRAELGRVLSHYNRQ